MDKDREYMSCPLNNKLCIGGINEAAPKHPVTKSKARCRWWQHLTGKDPQSEHTFDMWDCSIPWLPITTLETSQMARQSAASVDKLATVTHDVGNKVAHMAQGLAAVAKEFYNLNENVKNLPNPNTIEIPPNGNGNEGNDG